MKLTICLLDDNYAKCVNLKTTKEELNVCTCEYEKDDDVCSYRKVTNLKEVE